MNRKLYQGFPDRLAHDTPGWVARGAIFHIRVRSVHPILTEPDVAKKILDSARHYHELARWELLLFLVMPDHIHALLGFADNDKMSCVVGDWKRFQRVHHHIRWQEGFFDHRLRNEIEPLRQQAEYISMNPVVKGLCPAPGKWPWVLALT